MKCLPSPQGAEGEETGGHHEAGDRCGGRLRPRERLRHREGRVIAPLVFSFIRLRCVKNDWLALLVNVKVFVLVWRMTSFFLSRV